MAVLCAACTQPSRRFDLIVRGGEVIDGTGQPPRRADVGVVGDRITAIGDLASEQAGRVIDARGLAVAPGFIDVQGQSGTTLLADGNGESHLRQGITSEIIGEGGSPAFWTPDTADSDSLAPFGITVDWTGFDGYFNKLRQTGTTVNVGTFVPATMVRRAIVGMDNRPPTRRRADAHGSDGRSGDARRRVRVVQRIDLCAGIVCEDRGARRARARRGEAQGHLHHAHSRRELQPVQRARRGHHASAATPGSRS